MNNKLKIKNVLLCTLALVVFGCNSSSPGEATASRAETSGSTANASQATVAIDVCSLVTKEDVGAAISETIVQMEAKDDTCIYETEDGMGSRVQIEVKRTDAAGEMQAARDVAKILGKLGGEMKDAKGAEGDVGEMLAKDSASVSGIGDEAFFGANEQLFVLKNNVYFTVLPPIMRPRTGSGNPMLKAEEKRAMAKSIAQKVASKL
jgi:hypothetical protein